MALLRFSTCCLLLAILVKNSVPLPVPSNPPGDSISFEEVLDIVEDEGSEVTIIDVRTQEELGKTGKIPGSFNIPIKGDELKKAFSLLTPEAFEEGYGFSRPGLDEPFVLTCRSGRRARRAQKILVAMGYTKIRVYDGSWLEWTAKNGPVEQVSGKVLKDF